MKKLLFFLFFGLLFINSVLADCQYTSIEKYQEEETWFYHNGDFFEKNINLSQLVDVKVERLVITITNNLDVPITLNVSYKMKSSWFGDHDSVYTVTIQGGDYERIEDQTSSSCGSSFPCGIIDLKYYYVEPNIISSKNKVVEKNRTICRMCGNEICLNDGDSCNPLYDGSKCGSGICSIAGFCGHQKIVDCPNGKLSCNNQTCLSPSTKNVGDAYSCEWECKTGRGKDGVCTFSIRNWVIFLSIVLIATSILVWYFAIFRRKNEEKKLEEVQITIEKLSHEIDKLKIELDELENKKAKTSIDIEKIKELEEMLSVKQNKLIKLMDEKDKELKEIEESSPERKINLLLNKYQNNYETGGRKIYFDKQTSRFMVTSLYGGSQFLARYVYKKHIDKNLGNKTVHHVNYDQMIDEPWNLIALTKDQHDKIEHDKNLIKGNWDAGVEEIKKSLDWKESDFPEHIQLEIIKRKAEKQKKAEKYVKRSFRRNGR